MTRAAPPAELPVPLGGIVDDKFRVDRVLGAGGMGVVVEATHLLLRQKVALKFIRSEIARDSTNVARFLREARACVQLRNEHIARIMDVGTLPGDTPFIVMEYLEGRTADELVRGDGPLPPATAVTYLLQACVGMAEAHALGIVHRDLKPHNLFVTRTPAGRPLIKILDFGISKAALAGADDLGLTDSRTIVGSPAYMAPEQMESSRDVDARADIWSLGAILFTLVSGGPPFRGATLLQLCARVETGEREKLDERIPPEVVAVIDACLRRAPGDRPADLAALAAKLAPCAPGGDELAAEVEATLRTTRPAPAVAGDTPPKLARTAALETTVASADDSIVGATLTHSPPGPAPRRGHKLAAAAVAVAAIAGVAFFATRGRSKTATSSAVPVDAADTTSSGSELDAGIAIDAPSVDAPTVDAAPVTDAGASRRDRGSPPKRDAAMIQSLPPPPPPPPPVDIDAGVGDSSRHPRDRRN